jgi:hypothetical protein
MAIKNGTAGELFDGPGQVKFLTGETGTIVLLNTVGGADGEAEMGIFLKGQIGVTATDFVL